MNFTVYVLHYSFRETHRGGYYIRTYRVVIY